MLQLHAFEAFHAGLKQRLTLLCATWETPTAKGEPKRPWNPEIGE